MRGIVQKSSKIEYFESVRGLAAFAVVLAHICVLFFPAASGGSSVGPSHFLAIEKLLYSLPFGFLISGHFAVVIFFILSGYVLSAGYFATKRHEALIKQALKRYIRLGIPVAASVGLSFVLLSLGLIYSQEVGNYTGSAEALRVFLQPNNLWLALNAALYGVFVNADASYNPVLWTMRIELVGSFLVFFVAHFFAGFHRRWWFYLAMGVILWQSYYLCFLIGLAFADYQAHNPGKIRADLSAGWTALGLLVAAILGSFPGPSADMPSTIFGLLLVPNVNPQDIFRLWQIVGACALLYTVVRSSALQRLLSLRPLVYLGGVSFGLYLSHYLVLYSVGAGSFLLLREQFGYRTSALLASAIVLPVIFVVAHFWKRYIDDKSVELSSRFAAHMLRAPSNKKTGSPSGELASASEMA